MTDGSEPRFSATVLVGTGAALALLAAASFGLSFLRLGAWSLPAALAIAASKVALVVLVFMELWHERASTKLASLAALIMVLLLVTLTAADVATRSEPLVTPPAAAR